MAVTRANLTHGAGPVRGPGVIPRERVMGAARHTWRMRSRTAVFTAAAVGVAGAATLLGARRVRSSLAAWATNDDACDGDPVGMPAGDSVEVHAPDGAVLRGIDCVPDGDEAATVLLVHCWTGTRGNWGPVARRLVAEGFRVVAFDQRGHGESDRGTAPYSPETLGGDVAAIVEALDLRDVTVAGHSMGGLATMAFAGGHRDLAADRVRGLVLVATLASPSLPPRVPEGRPFNLAPALPLLARSMAHVDYGLIPMRQIFGTTPARSQIEATRQAFLDCDATTRAEAATMLLNFDLRPVLRDIDRPTTIVAGARDRLTWPHTNQAIADLIPNSRIEFLADKGHMLPWEDPESVTRAIVEAARA